LEKFSSIKSIKAWLNKHSLSGEKVGFVPTMGALHEGHLSLIRKAKAENDIVVCSIFVNPTQFNNLSDLNNYPRTIENDYKLLENISCTAVFVPTVTEIYPNFPAKTNFISLSLSPLDEVMEGAFRPGHFDGVVNVVYRLFDIIKPTTAYFGLKDFQQVAVIKYMVKRLDLPVKVVACETEREDSGLAKSSRNLRLSEIEKEKALVIHNTLQYGRLLTQANNPTETRKMMLESFQKGDLKLEYLEIIDPVSLLSLSDKWVDGAVCCIAAYCGEIRLIDNLRFID
jgi:pantoate--beta-alanine ligase